MKDLLYYNKSFTNRITFRNKNLHLEASPPYFLIKNEEFHCQQCCSSSYNSMFHYFAAILFFVNKYQSHCVQFRLHINWNWSQSRAPDSAYPKLWFILIPFENNRFNNWWILIIFYPISVCFTPRLKSVGFCITI